MADEDGGDVVRLAAQQRAAEPGEPTCAICGRYGEYICDATDDDVCSLECRDICTHNHQKQRAEVAAGEATVVPAPTTEAGSMTPTTGSDHRASHTVGDDDLVTLEIRKRLKIHVDVVGNVPTPALPPLCDSFDSLPAELRANIAKSGLLHLTPVQMQTIPVALTGAHVLVSAPTGTGKTAAFLLPLVVQILETRFTMETSVPLGLVLAPIRELAIQIEDAAKVFMKGIQKMKTALVVGGLPMPLQLHRLRQGVQLVVATPGRLLDILVHHSDDGCGSDALLDHVRYCVVDEVDMMLSVGFRDAVTQILGSLLASADRVQFIFTSATISRQVEHVISSCLGTRPASYVRIRIGDDASANGSAVSSAFTLHANVDHSVQWLEENDKKTELLRVLQERGAKQTLVFVDSKVGADMLAQAIEKQHRFLHARSFHAGKSQQERLQILEEFVDERVHVLVTTNVLGRGIDLLTVDLVVVFDAPKTTAEYVHIVGRVGRGVHGVADDDGSKLGASVMYVNARDAALFPELVQIYRQRRLRIPEEVYRSVRAKAPKTAPLVIVEEAKRAFRVLHELEHDDLASRASEWGRWKYSAKRPRYT